MASVASPLLPPARRGWGPIPHTLFKAVPRRLPPGAKTELVIVGNIVDDTLGAPGRPEWVRATLAYFAHLANVTEDAAGKAVKRLAALDLIECRQAGRGKEYRAKVENFERAPERAARHLRKPPAVAPDLHRAAPLARAGEAVPEPERSPRDTIKIVEIPVENSESLTPSPGGVDKFTYQSCPHCRAPLGESKANAGFADSSPSAGGNKRVTDSIPCVDAGYPAPGGGTGAPATPAEKKRQLESFCVATITPRLGTVPEKNALHRAIQTLGRAPVEWLTARITQRLELFRGPRASWGALPLLAQDVAQAHLRLGKIRGNTVPINLTPHWASAAEVRRLQADPATPEPVRTELLLMWPELRPPADRTQGRVSDEFAAFLKGEYGRTR